MNAPLISVIVPVYNTEKYLHRCVDSIINQTYQNLEIILVDDGSTDSSGCICDEYAKKDERIKVIHKKNAGQGAARNIALEYASGEYVGFVDSDDWIDPRMYQTLYTYAVKDQSDIVVCGRYLYWDDREKQPMFHLANPVVYSGREALAKLLIYDGIDSALCDKLCKKSLFKNIRFPLDRYICEDVDVVYKLLERAKQITHCGEGLYYYYQRSGSTSHPNVFSEKTKGMEIYHHNVYNYVQEKYPEYAKQAQYFYLSRLLILYNLLLDSNFKGDYKKAIKNEIKTNKKIVIKNPFFSKKEKGIYLLFSLGIYDLVYVIYSRFKIRNNRKNTF